MKDDSTLLVVGGLVAAFAAYEFFLKPKTNVVTAVAPIGTGVAKATTAVLPAATTTNPLTSLLQSAQKLLTPGANPNVQPITYSPGPNTAPLQASDNSDFSDLTDLFSPGVQSFQLPSPDGNDDPLTASSLGVHACSSTVNGTYSNFEA